MNCKAGTTMRRLGDYIRQVDVRNRDLEITNLKGLSIEKIFIESIANTIGTDLRGYKVVKPRQFAYVPVTSRNGEKITVALYDGENDCIISQAYTAFEIIDEAALLPEYLMMWFRRPEFDRYARFHSHGSAREIFDWEEMCDVLLPVPPIEEQREIVSRHKAIEHKIDVNRRLIAKLEETARTIYRHTFVENIDPENLPDGWRLGKLSDIAEYSSDRIDCYELTSSNYISTENMLKDRAGVFKIDEVPAGRCVKFTPEDILISNIRPYFKKIWQADKEGGCSADVLCFRPKFVSSQFLYYLLESDAFFDYVVAGCNGAKMPRGDKKWIMDYPIVIPNEAVENNFNLQVSVLKRFTQKLRKVNHTLSAL